MKISNRPEVKQPRLVCRAVQAWASLAGDGEAPQSGSWAVRHSATCAGCRDFFAKGGELSTALRSAALDGREAVPEGLDRRINAAVRRASGAPRAVRSSNRSWAWASGGVAALAVLAFVATRQPVDEERIVPSVVTVAHVDTGEAGPWDEGGAWDSWQPKTEALLEGEPLRREVDALYADARVALGFLALNFLPTSVAKAGEGTE